MASNTFGVQQDLVYVLCGYYPRAVAREFDPCPSLVDSGDDNLRPTLILFLDLYGQGQGVADPVSEATFEHVFNVIRRSGSEFRIVKTFRNVMQIRESFLIHCVHVATDTPCEIRISFPLPKPPQDCEVLPIEVPEKVQTPVTLPPVRFQDEGPNHRYQISVKPNFTFRKLFTDRFFHTLNPERTKNEVILKGKAFWLSLVKSFFAVSLPKQFGLSVEFTERNFPATLTMDGPNNDRKKRIGDMIPWNSDPFVDEDLDLDGNYTEASELVSSTYPQLPSALLSSTPKKPTALFWHQFGVNRSEPPFSLDHLRPEIIQDSINKWLDEIREQKEILSRLGPSLRLQAKYNAIPDEALSPFLLTLNYGGWINLNTGAEPMTFSCKVSFENKSPFAIDILVLVRFNPESPKPSAPLEDLIETLNKRIKDYVAEEFDTWFFNYPMQYPVILN